MCAQYLTVRLGKSHSDIQWGFRLHGGRDQGVPLQVQKVNGGSLAEKAGLLPGDQPIRINGVDCSRYTHREAHQLVIRAGNDIEMLIIRGSNVWRPHVTPTGPLPYPSAQPGPYMHPVTQTSLAYKPQEVYHVGGGYNNAARPFSGSFDNRNDHQVQSIVNKQYNTPVAMYSEEAIAETLSAQAEVLAGGVLGVNFKKNEKVYNAANSEVLKALHEQESDPQEPEPYAPQNFFWTASHAIGGRKSPMPPPKNIQCQTPTMSCGSSTAVNKHHDDERIGTPLQENTLAPGASHRPSLPPAQHQQQNQLRGVKSTISTINQGKSFSTSGTSSTLYEEKLSSDTTTATAAAVAADTTTTSSSSNVQHCDVCGASIVGPFARVNQKNYHADCFRCATCGTSLKNVGYYHVNHKIYCDIHAKAAAMAHPPTGTEGYVPVPIRPGTSLTAENINSAYEAFHVNGLGGPYMVPQPAGNTCYAYPRPFGQQFTQQQFAPPSISGPGQTAMPCSTPRMTANEPQYHHQSRPQYSSDHQSQYQQQGGYNPNMYGSTGEQHQQSSIETSQGKFSKLYNSAYKSPVKNPLTKEISIEQDINVNRKIEEHHYEDLEVENVTQHSGHVSSIIWPPPIDHDRCTPTASPLYIPPPETQKVIPKPIRKKEEQEQISEQQSQQQQQKQQQQQPCYTNTSTTQSDQYQQQQQQQQQYWQSRSAPELTTSRHIELESGSDSYTSTSTTTTTTSEEYQKMYQAQIQAYQMQQQMYEQSGSEIDYHLDMEVTNMQEQLQQNQEQSYSQLSFLSSQSGRRSVQECAETISGPVSTYRLVDLVREITPSPKPQAIAHKQTRKVEFADSKEHSKDDEYHKKQESCTEMYSSSVEIKSLSQAERTITADKVENVTDDFSNNRNGGSGGEGVDEKCHRIIQPEDRKFQPTPEIVIEIPEAKPIPPTNIPNPTPKEWISPMVKALTTAPDKPIEITDLIRHCESPCGAKECENVCVTKISSKTDEITKGNNNESKRTAINEKDPEILRESPPKGSFIAKTLTTAPTDTVKFAPNPNDIVPLPEETEPYMPPPIDKKPYLRDDFRPKSPLLSALITAPETPFSSFGHDVISQLDDLPTPKSKLTMKDALTVASDRCYTPLCSENVFNLNLEENKRKQSSSVVQFEYNNNHEIESCDHNIIDHYSDEQNSKTKTLISDFVIPVTPRNSVASLTNHNQQQTSYLTHRDSLQLNAQQKNSLSSPSTSTITDTHEQRKLQEKIIQENSIQSCTSSSFKSMNISQMHQHQTHQISSSSTTATVAGQKSICLKSQCQQEKSDETEQKIIYPPPAPTAITARKTALSSGLHKPETIPQYQRNWTILPSQRPVRTPEPQELKENVPLAFVDVPRDRSPSVQKQLHCNQDQIKSTASSVVTQTNSTGSDMTRKSSEINLQTHSTVPVIIENRIGPITMTFQSIDDQKTEDHSQAHPRPFTPSLINKPAPIIPFYQTPEKLVFEECQPTVGHPFDRRSASPFPDRAKSPAPGPPPNPLGAIRAPRIKDEDNICGSGGYRNLQVGSITTGQSCYASQACQQQQQQGQVLSHYQAASQYGTQSYIDKPEIVQQTKIGDTMIQTREKESHLNEEQHKELQSKTTTQVGNAQIERRRRVVEEYEHTQSAKTIEIQKTSASATNTTFQQQQLQKQQCQQQQLQQQQQQLQQQQQQHHHQQLQQAQRQQYGKTGYVANQARRLSNLEQEISSISSQSQAISARAANLGVQSPTTFPFFTSPEPVSKFPTKPDMPAHDEPKEQAYIVSTEISKKLVIPPPGFQKQQQQLRQQQQQYHHEEQKQALSSQYSAYASSSSSSIAQSSSIAAQHSLLTNAATTKNITNSNNINNLSSSTASNLTTAIPVPAFKPPITSIGNKNSDALYGGNKNATNLHQPSSNNNTYKPTPSTGPAGFKPPAPQPSSSLSPSVVVSDPSPASTGPSTKGGTFGATSAPKRGRGILNKAVGPGVRIPLCGCCNTQIRGPFITALGRIWCPDHFICVRPDCRRPLQDIGFVEENGDLYCEFCFEKYLAPKCSKCCAKIKGDCLNAIGKHFHPECFSCAHCGKLFGNTPFFLEEGEPYCEVDWNELFTTKCFACGFPVEAGDRWVEALNHNYHSQCFNCTMCKKNLEGQSFYNKGGRPFCKNHAR